MNARYQGVFPVVPTIFDATGALDLDGQRRCLEFMIDAGSQGLCIHANYSEQFALGDDERDLITRATLEHVAGRVPVIVTTSHFSARICAERNRRAQARRGDGDGDAAVSRRDVPRAGGAGARVLPRSRRRPRHSADDPGCARERRRAVRAVPRVARPRDRRGVVLQDRDGRCRVEAARADRARRRCDRGAVGRRGRHHAARRSRCRRDRRDDGRRLSGRDSPHHRRVFRRPSRRSRRAVRALAAADQLREPSVGIPDREGADARRRRDRVRQTARTVARAASPVRAGLLDAARQLDPLVLRWGARREAPCIGSPVQRRRALRTGASRRDSGPSEDRRRHHPDWRHHDPVEPGHPGL